MIPGKRGPPVRKKPLLCRNCPGTAAAARKAWAMAARAKIGASARTADAASPDHSRPAVACRAHSQPSGGLALPALESILGRARLETAPPQSLERCLGELFGLASGPCRTPQSAARARRRWRQAVARCFVPIRSTSISPRTPAARRCQRPRDQHSAGRADCRRAERDVFRRGPLRGSRAGPLVPVDRRPAGAQLHPLAEVAGRPMGPFMPEGPTRASGTVSATRSRSGSTTTR